MFYQIYQFSRSQNSISKNTTKPNNRQSGNKTAENIINSFPRVFLNSSALVLSDGFGAQGEPNDNDNHKNVKIREPTIYTSETTQYTYVI